MEITQEDILALLVEGGGKVNNSDLLGRFKGCLNSADPAKKKSNRDLFKQIVNNFAVVKEIDDVKFIVLKRKYQHLMTGEHRTPESNDNEESRSPGEHTTAQSETTEECRPVHPGGGRSVPADSQQQTTSGGSDPNSDENESPSSAVELALQRSTFDFKLKRALHLEMVQSSEQHGGNDISEWARVNEPAITTPCNKPYGLPLRMPQSDRKTEIHKLKCDPPEHLEPSPHKGGPETLTPKSPSIGRKSAKLSEEPGEPRFATATPLDPSEHEWLVKSAAGHWGQVYGLLLRDNQLVEKRDFMSGFTALHWAAKSGNSDMLEKMIKMSRSGGVDIDVNARTHGGYTPLHIAALHDQAFIIDMLVREYGADASIRDNCGKRAYHYLHKGIPGRVRQLLGEPKVQHAQDSVQPDREEVDLFQDLSKGLHTISRLFQPNVSGHKKKHKHRAEVYSLSEEPRDENDEARPT